MSSHDGELQGASDILAVTLDTVSTIISSRKLFPKDSHWKHINNQQALYSCFFLIQNPLITKLCYNIISKTLNRINSHGHWMGQQYYEQQEAPCCCITCLEQLLKECGSAQDFSAQPIQDPSASSKSQFRPGTMSLGLHEAIVIKTYP